MIIEDKQMVVLKWEVHQDKHYLQCTLLLLVVLELYGEKPDAPGVINIDINANPPANVEPMSLSSIPESNYNEPGSDHDENIKVANQDVPQLQLEKISDDHDHDDKTLAGKSDGQMSPFAQAVGDGLMAQQMEVENMIFEMENEANGDDNGDNDNNDAMMSTNMGSISSEPDHDMNPSHATIVGSISPSAVDDAFAPPPPAFSTNVEGL